MPSPSVTYTFANSTTADATQVNQNFTDLINGMTDGTKDFSISALTVAGTATLNGDINLGNANADTLTITASLGSSIPIKTTFTYDFGASTLGLKSLYLGSNDGAGRTIRLIAPAVASSYTYTFPTTGGTAGFVQKTDGSGGASWESRLTYLRSAKTGNYTATTSDEVLTCDASGGSFTITLPAAASTTNKVLKIIRTDLTLANAVTIDANASETINGALTIKLMTQYESVEIVCDGSNWFILDREMPSSWVSYTPTFGGLGTVSGVNMFWMRERNNLVLRGQWSCGTITATGATVSIPSGLTINATYLNGGSEIHCFGYYLRGPTSGIASMSNTANMIGGIFNSFANTTSVQLEGRASSSGGANDNATTIFANTDFGAIVTCRIPITGWDG